MARSRRDRMCSWRCQWSVVTITVVALVIYNAAANMWLLRPASCQSSAPSSSPAPTPVATCEPCADTPYAAVTDDPIGRLDLRLGRWDASRSFKMYDNAAVGESYADLSSSRRVALATQSSIERLHELLQITAHWSGPISVAVFVAGNEMTLLRGFVAWLARCEPDVFRRVALHVAAPAERPAALAPAPRWAADCAAPPLQMDKLSSKWHIRHPYPQNVMRNLARKNCHTSFVFLVDIDIVPSRGMAEALDKFLSTAPNCPLCAYVIPTYELDNRVANFPANKSELLRLAAKQLAIPFHTRVFIYNQYASNFTKWASTKGKENEETHVSHTVTNFEMLYEPFYVAADNTPPHDERFLGYGFTRNTQLNSQLECVIKLHDGQHGFKSGLSTESAILSLKHTVKYYDRRTPVYACFLDLSKAFDLVSYDFLRNKLEKAGLPKDVLNIFKY